MLLISHKLILTILNAIQKIFESQIKHKKHLQSDKQNQNKMKHNATKEKLKNMASFMQIILSKLASNDLLLSYFEILQQKEISKSNSNTLVKYSIFNKSINSKSDFCSCCKIQCEMMKTHVLLLHQYTIKCSFQAMRKCLQK